MKLFKKGKYYHARIRSASGKYTTVSTKATTKEDAVRMASESGLKDMEDAARSGRLTQEAIGRITTGGKLTMTGAMDQYAKWMKARGKSSKTIYNNQVTIMAWVHDLGIESLPPAAITEQHIDEWINQKKKASGAGTRRFELSAIRSFFAYASAKGWCAGDPSALVDVNFESLTHGQKEPKIPSTFTKADVQKILAHCEGFWNLAVRLSYECGLRLGDICQLEWNCFIHRGYVVAWTDKRNRRVAVPISEELVQRISQHGMFHPRFVFPDQAAVIKDVKRRSLLSVQFARLLEKCGIEGKSFHGLRHTFATNLKKEGKTIKDIQVVMGHASHQTTEGYVHE